MTSVKCRLCSSSNSLISLFSGKCRDIRNYIRKLTEFTTGIKFEKNDVLKCICCACAIQVYNFYIFKSRSIQNEKKLQDNLNHHERCISKRREKLEFLDLDDIHLPDVEEVCKILVPWLKSKRELVESKSNNCEEKNNKKEKEESKTIVITLENKHFSSQETFDKSVQSEFSNQWKYSQTDVPEMKTVELQCELLNENNTPFHFNNIQDISQWKYTQTDVPEMKTVELQCELLNENNTSFHFNNIQDISQIEPKYDIINLDKLIDDSSKTIFLNNVGLQLMGIKEEKEFVSPRNIITRKSFNLNSSPISNKGQDTMVCKICAKVILSGSEYALHKKSHLKCNICKQKFTSFKKTKFHLENECEMYKFFKNLPEVALVRLEDMKKIKKDYPESLDILNELVKKYLKSSSDVKPNIRLRSRSVDSFFNQNYIADINCLSVLSKLTLGVDKSVQTNSLVEESLLKYLPHDIFKPVSKRNYANSKVANDLHGTKKIKLSF